MPILIQYLIKLSISLAIVWLFYQLVLRRLTFYNWNRWFLLGYSLVAFFISFIDISPVLEEAQLTNHSLVQFIPAIENFTAEKNVSMSRWDWALIVLAIGCLILLIRLVIQHFSFLRLRRSAKLILAAPVKLYQIDKEIIPFSFGDSIFINQHQHSEEDLKKIIRHEFIHVKQKHSIDMLWAEWLCILNWYNPFVWLIRNAIRQNLEFIADHKVVQNGIDKKQYQYLLLKVVGISQYSIAANFNFTSLKKRIAMMNRMRSAKVHLMKFFFVLPLIGIMLLAFRNAITNQANNSIKAEFLILDTIPKPPAPPQKPALPKNVKSIVDINNEITVTLKDGTKERYDLSRPEDKEAFEKKYGPLPEPPLPPSPPSPSPSPMPEVPANVSSIDIIGKTITIKLKNGKVEKYDMNKPAEKAAFEKKYFEIKPAHPAAPAIPSEPDKPSAPAVAPTAIVITAEPVLTFDVKAPVVQIDAIPPPIVAVPVVSKVVVDIKPLVDLSSPVEEIELIAEISYKNTSVELDRLKDQLAGKGYTLSFQKIHSKNGLLQSVEGTIADDKSRSRFVADDFSKVMIHRVTDKNGKSGFVIRIVVVR